MKYQSFNIHNFRTIPQIMNLPEELVHSIEVVAQVLPFKTNNYVVESLIDWSNVPDDPMFILTFPQKDMLIPEHFRQVEELLARGADSDEISTVVGKIRDSLNPHPAGQMQHNTPIWQGARLEGSQHKYRETVVFFPSRGQICHAYCTFCFRWPQFSGAKELKFAARDTEILVDYVANNPGITDVLFTGGDPIVMKTSVLAEYLVPLIKANIPHLRNIRIGSKALTYWPYRFLTDEDAEELLELFREVKRAGKHLAYMANFNHPSEFQGEVARQAIGKILETGAVIRTQSPLLRHINDVPEIWARMWQEQVALGCIPYYMFVARDTGAQQYFAVTLNEAWQIFQKAYQSVSGICRTVRGPVMACLPGKVQILGAADIQGEKVFTLRMIQGRNPDWVARPFFSKFDNEANWYSDLKPAFGGEKFFFQDELDVILSNNRSEDTNWDDSDWYH